jgi:hypothetical protein
MSFWESLGRLIAKSQPADKPSEPGEIEWLRDQVAMFNHSRVRLHPLRDSLANPTNETWEMRRLYPTLLREPTLKAAFFGSMLSVAALELNCTPAGGRTATDADRQCAEFMRHYINGRRTSCLHLVESLGFGGRIHGFSVCHKKRKREDKGRWEGKWVIDRFKPKPVVENRIELEVDEFNNLTAIQANWPNGGRRYDPADFVVFTYLKLFDQLTGMSDFRAVRRAVKMKEDALTLRMIMLDKFSGPYFKGKYAKGQDGQRREMEAALKKARGEGYIVFESSPGNDVEVVDLTMKSYTEFKSAIEDLDQEIARGINFATLHMFTSGGKNDPRGSAKVQQETSQIDQWYMAAILADAIQQYVIPEGVEDNFGANYDLPVVTVGGVSADAILKDLEVDAAIQAMGGGVDSADVYRRANRPMPAGTPAVLYPIPVGAQAPAVGPAATFQ